MIKNLLSVLSLLLFLGLSALASIEGAKALYALAQVEIQHDIRAGSDNHP